MTKREAMDLLHQENRLAALGISREDAAALRRISMTLRRWFELECGDSNSLASYAVERDEETNVPYMAMYGHNGQRTKYRIPDRETGARKRLATIMARYPGLVAYVQGDPRGCSLYILRAEDVAGHDVNSVYTRGVAVA